MWNYRLTPVSLILVIGLTILAPHIGFTAEHNWVRVLQFADHPAPQGAQDSTPGFGEVTAYDLSVDGQKIAGRSRRKWTEGSSVDICRDILNEARAPQLRALVERGVLSKAAAAVLEQGMNGVILPEQVIAVLGYSLMTDGASGGQQWEWFDQGRILTSSQNDRQGVVSSTMALFRGQVFSSRSAHGRQAYPVPWQVDPEAPAGLDLLDVRKNIPLMAELGALSRFDDVEDAGTLVTSLQVLIRLMQREAALYGIPESEYLVTHHAKSSKSARMNVLLLPGSRVLTPEIVRAFGAGKSEGFNALKAAPKPMGKELNSQPEWVLALTLEDLVEKFSPQSAPHHPYDPDQLRRDTLLGALRWDFDFKYYLSHTPPPYLHALSSQRGPVIVRNAPELAIAEVHRVLEELGIPQSEWRARAGALLPKPNVLYSIFDQEIESDAYASHRTGLPVLPKRMLEMDKADRTPGPIAFVYNLDLALYNAIESDALSAGHPKNRYFKFILFGLYHYYHDVLAALPDQAIQDLARHWRISPADPQALRETLLDRYEFVLGTDQSQLAGVLKKLKGKKEDAVALRIRIQAKDFETQMKTVLEEVMESSAMKAYLQELIDKKLREGGFDHMKPGDQVNLDIDVNAIPGFQDQLLKNMFLRVDIPFKEAWAYSITGAQIHQWMNSGEDEEIDYEAIQWAKAIFKRGPSDLRVRWMRALE